MSTAYCVAGRLHSLCSCTVLDGNDEREDRIELNLNIESDSGSESVSEIKCSGDSFQEARDGTLWVEQTAGNPQGRA